MEALQEGGTSNIKHTSNDAFDGIRYSLADRDPRENPAIPAPSTPATTHLMIYAIVWPHQGLARTQHFQREAHQQ